MSNRAATPEHEVAYQDIVALLNKHAGRLSAEELLAVCANVVGKIIALQDQRTMSREKATRIVLANIELGNQQIIDQLKNIEGQA